MLVELADAQPGIIGARLTGGGFGGCTVNLVEFAHAETFRKGIHAAYLERAGIDADIYLCQAAAGHRNCPSRSYPSRNDRATQSDLWRGLIGLHTRS